MIAIPLLHYCVGHQEQHGTLSLFKSERFQIPGIHLRKFLQHPMHLSMGRQELITNLRAKKVLCHCAKVAKTFRCYNHRLCFLQCDWQRESFLQKVIVNEA